MPRRREFSDPIIRISADRIRFPDLCPVCCRKAAAHSIVAAQPGSQWQGARDAYWSRRASGPSHGIIRTFSVPVCNSHFISDDSEWRGRSLCMLMNGIMVAVLLFATFVAGGSYWQGRGVPSWYAYLLTLFMIMAIGSGLMMRGQPLQRAINIIGFDCEVRYVWLDLKNREYREMFLSENRVNAELVSWIVTT